MKKEIILVGGGGHCESCIDVLETENKYRIREIVDISEKLGQKILKKYSIKATDENLGELAKLDFAWLITIGQIKSSQIRKEKFELLKKLNCYFPVIISPKAYVSPYAVIQEGSIVMHQAFINVGAKIGKNCILNTKSCIEHNVAIGDHTHISTGAIINGDAVIGDNVFIGSNAVLLQGINIVSDVIIGAGAVVLSSIKDKGIYVGNPIKKIR